MEIELEKWKKAGEITAKALEYAKTLIKIDSSLKEVTEQIEAKIVELGGKLAFPSQISFNETAAHNYPSIDDTTVFKKGDLIKVDIGVHIDGCVGDSAITIDLGENKKLVEASEKALDEAIKIIRPGIKLWEIGKVIEDTISGFGFKPVKNLSGHGLAPYIVHQQPTIPNYNNEDETQIKKGDLFAIEPFATNGAGFIEEGHGAEIFQLVEKKPVRSQVTRNIIKEIESYKGMPFSSLWLAKKFPVFQVNFALREINALDMLRKHPPLVERAKGLVSQAEHSVYVGDEVVVLTKL